MSDSNKVEVEIAGSFYTLISKKTESEVRTLASYVDDNIRDLRKSNKRLSPLMASNLAAMNIAEQYFDTKDKMEYKEKTYNDLWERSKKPIESYPKLVEENKENAQLISRLKSENNTLTINNKEYSDKIETLSRKVEILESDSGEIVKKIQQESDDNLSKLKFEYETKLKETDDKSEKEINRLKEENKNIYEKTKKESDEKIQNLIKDTDDRYNLLKNKSEDEYNQLKEDSEKKLTELKKISEEKYNKLKKDSDVEYEKLKNHAQEILDKKEKEYDELYENMKSSMETEMENLKKKMEEIDKKYNDNLILVRETQDENYNCNFKLNGMQKELQELKGKVE